MSCSNALVNAALALSTVRNHPPERPRPPLGDELSLQTLKFLANWPATSGAIELMAQGLKCFLALGTLLGYKERKMIADHGP